MSRIVLFLVVLVLTGGAFLAGAAMVHVNAPPYQMLKSAAHRLSPPPAPAGTDPVSPQILELPDERVDYDFETILLRLAGREISVPLERWGTGGNVAAFGEGALLMTRLGNFFWSDGPDTLVRLPISLPDNGLGDFMHVIDTYYPDRDHNFNWMRYIDVLAVPEDAQATSLVVSYTDFNLENRCYATVVVRSTAPVPHTIVSDEAGATVEWTEVFRTEPCLELKTQGETMAANLAGARMALGPEGDLYIGMGDYYYDGERGRPLAQLDDNDYGKTLRISLADGTAETISKGHRNPQGLAFDTDGTLYSVEHGARGGDELNMILPGANYGAPLETLGTDYDGQSMPLGTSFGRHEEFEAPRYAFLPSVAISTLNRVNAGFHDGWEGDFILATMKDQSIYRIRLRDKRVLLAERIEIGQRVRAALPLGERLLLWTDDAKLIWLEPRDLNDTSDLVSAVLQAMDMDAQMAARARTAVARCQQCHSLVPGGNAGAPTLAGVAGNDIASRPFAGYSDALMALEGDWTRERLVAYLQSPQEMAPGTVMPAAGIGDPVVIETLVDFLFALSREG